MSSQVWTARGGLADARRSARRVTLVVSTSLTIVAVATLAAVTLNLARDGEVLGWSPSLEPLRASPLPADAPASDDGVASSEAEEATDVDPSSSDGSLSEAVLADRDRPQDDDVDTAVELDEEAGQAAERGQASDGGDGPAVAVAEDAGEVGAAFDPDAAGVEEIQARLRELGYLVGAVDGRRGPQTVAAIMAFQRVQGLAVDGIAGPQTRAALAGAPVEPSLAGGAGTRIEIDLDSQLLHVVEDGVRVVTLHVSSGNGRPYRSASGGTAYGRTPVGDFELLRRIDGRRVSRLGTLYDPLYFHHGFAIHGSGSVPAGPASHGCVRITRADSRWLLEQVEVGFPVHLHGGEHVFRPG